MKLIRNTNSEGKGKYTVIDNRTGKPIEAKVGDPEEYFVLKLKDRATPAALYAYADEIRRVDPEFADEIYDMAGRSARMPNRKWPD